MSDTESEFFQRWLTLWKNIDNAFNAVLRRVHLSYNEYLLLESLKAAPRGMEPSALADARELSRQHVNLLLRQLEAAGLITRTEATVDKRRRIIAISPAGEEMLAGIKTAWMDLDAAGWASFAPYERGRIISLLEHYYATLSGQ